MMRKRLERHENIEPSENNKAAEFMKDVQSTIDYKDISSAVCFVKHTDGFISAITSDGDAIDIIGLIEVGKNIVYEDRFHND